MGLSAGVPELAAARSPLGEIRVELRSRWSGTLLELPSGRLPNPSLGRGSLIDKEPPVCTTRALCTTSRGVRQAASGELTQQSGRDDATDTWEWDGTSWVQRAATGIPFTNGLIGAYHAGLGRTVAWTGLETWQWDGATWSLLPATGVQPDVTGMAYDALRDRITGVSPKPGFPSSAVEVHELASGSAAGAYPYGAGCGSPVLALTQVAGHLPVLGTTAQVTLAQVPAGFAVVAVGFSDTALGPYQLPASLTFLGMPGCTLLRSSEAPCLASPSGPGTAGYSLLIPNQPALFGLRLFLQGWAIAPGANAAGLVASNGICWVCG